jgi:hypothetical protein
MTYQPWDKTSPIYDITAEQAMINNPLYGSENSYLILRDDGSILDILPISTLRKLTGKSETATDDEVCAAYIAKLNEPPPAPQSGDVSALSAKVAELEEQLATIEAVNKTILGVE